MPLGVTTPEMVTLLTAPVFRSIVPRKLGHDVVRLGEVLGAHGSLARRLEAVLQRIAKDELLNGKRPRGAGAGGGSGRSGTRARASGCTQTRCDDRGAQPSSCTQAKDGHRTFCMRPECRTTHRG